VVEHNDARFIPEVGTRWFPRWSSLIMYCISFRNVMSYAEVQEVRSCDAPCCNMRYSPRMDMDLITLLDLCGVDCSAKFD